MNITNPEREQGSMEIGQVWKSNGLVGLLILSPGSYLTTGKSHSLPRGRLSHGDLSDPSPAVMAAQSSYLIHVGRRTFFKFNSI